MVVPFRDKIVITLFPSTISTFTLFTMPNLDLLCGICRENITEGDRYVVCQTGCQKLLHERCVIDCGLMSNCPFCRQPANTNRLEFASTIHLLIEIVVAITVCIGFILLAVGIICIFWWSEKSRYQMLLEFVEKCGNRSTDINL